ncbi:MAG: anti-sigma factor antagonist [Candidatus Abyssobacteria bacterium SURF_17]|jgi:anti-sigma B factor antagonist|uniref:Anti-sigma factor antagonist n=1 Tax=Candidatus Abyssobacteria bacterium SURF_17 TaxID=2093361 RepID=A0A419EPE9_9BACT|nr:MAG: anti-sigma factor antagonist [Candidatus Abyssubacteria bacterium SURF_17]
MEVSAKRSGNGAVIKVSGDVDLYSSPRLREAILDSVKKRLTPIVVNLAGVTYIDSSGIATLVEGLQLSREYGGKLRLVSLNDRVSEVLHLARLQRVFEIRGTEAEALED